MITVKISTKVNDKKSNGQITIKEKLLLLQVQTNKKQSRESRQKKRPNLVPEVTALSQTSKDLNSNSNTVLGKVLIFITYFIITLQGLPGGPVVKNPPSNAGDAGSIAAWGTKIPHATGQLSPRATTTEPMRSRAHVPQLEKSPSATTREASATQRRSHLPQLRPDAAK